ncbi:uncharacterized protein LOC143842655 [Paroedura picta]|uniref:uncharacterized protein LOC143842655 n=1 Tax=Paroedura picta TaxID=143630 RepID=UPI004055D3B2
MKIGCHACTPRHCHLRVLWSLRQPQVQTLGQAHYHSGHRGPGTEVQMGHTETVGQKSSGYSFVDEGIPVGHLPGLMLPQDFLEAQSASEANCLPSNFRKINTTSMQN